MFSMNPNSQFGCIGGNDRPHVAPRVHVTPPSRSSFAARYIPLFIQSIQLHARIPEYGWSRRLEDIRKDIGYCFGIIKGRWKPFKHDTLFDSQKNIDNAWFTVAIPHNMLHKFDGMDRQGGDVDWEGSTEMAAQSTISARRTMAQLVNVHPGLIRFERNYYCSPFQAHERQEPDPVASRGSGSAKSAS